MRAVRRAARDKRAQGVLARVRKRCPRRAGQRGGDVVFPHHRLGNTGAPAGVKRAGQLP